MKLGGSPRPEQSYELKKIITLKLYKLIYWCNLSIFEKKSVRVSKELYKFIINLR